MRTKPALFDANPDNIDKVCPGYKNLYDAKEGSGERDWLKDGRKHCEDLWKDYEPLADAHFLTEFPLHPHPRWFEMYLAVSLMRAGYNITHPEYGSDGGGPDLLMTVDNQKIWIEAVCAGPGDPGKSDSVPKLQFEKVNSISMDKIALRARSSLKDKACQYTKYLKNGAVSKDDILVVAINVHQIPSASTYMHGLAIRTLYGSGDQQAWINKYTHEFSGTGREQRASITKANNAEVNMQPFIDESMPHITAALWSHADVVNRLNSLGGDFILSPNLASTVPWSKGLIKLGEELSFKENDKEGYWQGESTSYR